MGSSRLVGRFAVALLTLAVAATAQGRITVPATANVGDSITISYSNPALAGQKVTIRVDNGGYPDLITVEYEIQLDQDGKGSIDWLVLDWWLVNINAPGALQATVAIDS